MCRCEGRHPGWHCLFDTVFQCVALVKLAKSVCVRACVMKEEDEQQQQKEEEEDGREGGH